VKESLRTVLGLLLLIAIAGFLSSSPSTAQSPAFHDAPPSAKKTKNPLAGQAAAIQAGESLFAKCATCHGSKGAGTGNVPSLTGSSTQSAADGEIFWYITKGDVDNGMPSWSGLPEKQRWQIIAYVRALGHPTVRPAASSPRTPAPMPSADTAIGPPPPPPFTDYRFEKPGLTRKITLADLPAPYATASAGNAPDVVPRPENAWPQVPEGFKVEQYADGLDEPRLIRIAPNGDFFVAESAPGIIRIFRGITADGKPQQISVFASHLKQPFGINFYPPGNDPQWVYVGNTNAVVRFPYQNGDLKARGPAQHLLDLPGNKGHVTRDLQFSRDGKKMWVSVGSGSNVDDPDTTPAETNRADILEFNPDGSNMRIYAYGIRNAVGLAVNSKTGELWCSVNERDGLGDNLVPDYITHVQEGGFYGWPWWYMGSHQDPRHQGKHPELKDRVITPDVILQPHNASLEMTFYDGSQFPAEYQGDIFAAEHGSWNKSVRTSGELIRIPLHQTGHASGEYQDFMTGFVVDNKHVWGRPVGVAIGLDGSIFVTDDASGSIWRIIYTGK
jgi:glucose/arabinose dehydrogenase/mono/diheme cytochrome c family protein